MPSATSAQAIPDRIPSGHWGMDTSINRPGPVVSRACTAVTIPHAAYVPAVQSERDALLVAVQVDELRRLAAVERRPPRARDLAVERLDLDDLGPVVAEHRRRERAGEGMRQIQDDEIAERRPPRHSSTAA